jgi:hypothetical protein
MSNGSGPLAELADAVDSKSTGRKAIPVRFRGGPPIWLLLIALSGCHREPPPPQTPPPRDCSEGGIKVLSDLMACRMGPWQKGKVTDAEVRQSFIRIREFAPLPEWNEGPSGWSNLVDEALATGNYGTACNACHKAHIKEYRANLEFRQRPLPPAPK